MMKTSQLLILAKVSQVGRIEMENTKKILDVRNLRVNYGHIQALSGINFHVNKNEIVTLIGSNGAGKTTSLMAISGMVPKLEGQVYFEDLDITNTPAHKIARLGISHVPEGRKIFPDLTVEENLVVGTVKSKNKTIDKSYTQSKLEEVYELFPRLRERYKQGGGTLSGGEQQMLAIGRGLMMEPDLLILDEPSLGLAPIIVEEIFEMILKIRREENVSILLVEQNASMALSIADRGYVLETGNIKFEGSGKELAQSPEIRKSYLGG